MKPITLMWVVTLANFHCIARLCSGPAGDQLASLSGVYYLHIASQKNIEFGVISELKTSLIFHGLFDHG